MPKRFSPKGNGRPLRRPTQIKVRKIKTLSPRIGKVKWKTWGKKNSKTVSW